MTPSFFTHSEFLSLADFLIADKKKIGEPQACLLKI